MSQSSMTEPRESGITLTEPRKGTKVAKVDVEKLGAQYAAESKMIGSSAIRFIAEDDEDLDFERAFQPPRCKCKRVLAFRLPEYQRRMKEKRPDQTPGDILDDMGIDPHKCLSCRDYFINQFKFTSGTLHSGDVTILPADDVRPFPRRIENNLPKDLYLEGKEYVVYDKWSPVPIPKSLLVKPTIGPFKKDEKGQIERIARPRRYHLTGYQIKSNFDTYLDLYKAWSKTMGKLLPIWSEAIYPDLDFDSSRAWLESAFFQELCGVFETEKASQSLENKRASSRKEIFDEDNSETRYPRPNRKNLFDMQIKRNVDQFVEDQQNCYLFFRSNDKPPEMRAALLIPTAKRALYFTFTENEMVAREDYRFAGDSLTEIISGNTKASEILLGKTFSWAEAVVYIRRERFLLPNDSSVRKMIDDATKELRREASKRKAAEKEDPETEEFRPRTETDRLILTLDELKDEINQAIHSIEVSRAEARAELEDLEWTT